jgi:hypothetical protein
MLQSILQLIKECHMQLFSKGEKRKKERKEDIQKEKNMRERSNQMTD